MSTTIIDKMRYQIKWLTQQVECIKEKGCLCFSFETDLSYNPETGELSATFTDDSTKTVVIPPTDASWGNITGNINNQTDLIGLLNFKANDNEVVKSVNSILPDANGNVNVVEPTGLEAIDEGNGVGWRLIGRDPDFYGNIGNEAIDLSAQYTSDNVRGATGANSVAIGYRGTASGGRSTVVGGSGGLSSGYTSIVLGGSNNNATDTYTAIVGGLNNTSTKQSAVVIGGQNNASSGNQSAIIGGVSNTTTGSYSVSIGGSSNEATGLRSVTISGNNSVASGNESIVLGGYNNYARSYYEVVTGYYPTDYVPTGPSTFAQSDRLFNIGNGTSATSSDAFTILKNGETGIGIDNFEANTTGELLQVNGVVSATDFVIKGTFPYVNSALNGGATATTARSRKKGNVVEVELRGIEFNDGSITIPVDHRPSAEIYVYAHSGVSTDLIVPLTVSTNGVVQPVGTTQGATEIMNTTFQFTIF